MTVGPVDKLMLQGLIGISFAFLASAIWWSRQRRGSWWAISWITLLAAGTLLAFDPAGLLLAVTRMGGTLFTAFQLAGAYAYVGRAVPRWVVPLGLAGGLFRVGMVETLGAAPSHLAVLPLELGLLGGAAWILYREGRPLEGIDRLLIVGALVVAALQAVDAVNDLLNAQDSVLWAPWFGLGAAVAITQLVGVSERIRGRSLEEQLDREERDRRAQKLESLGMLAGGIAHDFNNLLTGILGNAEIAAAEVGEDHAAAEPLAECITAATKAADLTAQLLTYASGRRFEARPIDLARRIRESEALLRTAVGSGVTLEIETAPDAPLTLGDPDQLDQVVMTLAQNAGEACDERPGHVRIALDRHDHGGDALPLTVGTLVPGLHLRLVVEDTGRGIDDASLERIFDPFYSTKFTGRGLGLAVSHRILLDHGAALRVTSQPGEGSRFEAFLPVTNASLEKTLAQAPPPAERPLRILVVDDDPVVLRVTAVLLESAGHEVTRAEGGERAIEILADPEVELSLLLLDATMPGVGSPEVLRRRLVLRPELPVVLMSGHDPERVSREVAGGVPLPTLRKPFGREALLEMVAAGAGGGEASD